MQTATAGAVEAIQSIGATITRLNEIAAAIEEQGAATAEITRNVQQTAGGTQEVSRNIAGVTQASTETGRAASQVLEASTELARQGETLRAEVDTFVGKVRAA